MALLRNDLLEALEPMFTLTQIATALEVRQHRLIHLCEKGVIEPDLGEASGRGSSRRFSAASLLEFGIALELRKLELPITVAQHVTSAVRSFFGVLRRNGTRIPEDLVGGRPPSLTLEIIDGHHVILVHEGSRRGTRIMTAPPLEAAAEPPHRTVLRKSSTEELRRLLEGARTRLHLNVTRIARDLDQRLGLSEAPT